MSACNCSNRSNPATPQRPTRDAGRSATRSASCRWRCTTTAARALGSLTNGHKSDGRHPGIRSSDSAVNGISTVRSAPEGGGGEAAVRGAALVLMGPRVEGKFARSVAHTHDFVAAVAAATAVSGLSTSWEHQRSTYLRGTSNKGCVQD